MAVQLHLTKLAKYTWRWVPGVWHAYQGPIKAYHTVDSLLLQVDDITWVCST